MKLPPILRLQFSDKSGNSKLQKEMKLLNVKIEDAVDNEEYEIAAQSKTRLSQITKELRNFKLAARRARRN